MRSTYVGLFASLAFFLGLLDETRAQPYYGNAVTRGTVAPAITAYPSQGSVMPYSYWVTAPSPARIYAGYGAIDQFPFYGRPYGNPSDRWSWYNLGGGDSRYLAKYYYPPLR